VLPQKIKMKGEIHLHTRWEKFRSHFDNSRLRKTQLLRFIHGRGHLATRQAPPRTQVGSCFCRLPLSKHPFF
jgi:hypothetical protein